MQLSHKYVMLSAWWRYVIITILAYASMSIIVWESSLAWWQPCIATPSIFNSSFTWLPLLTGIESILAALVLGVIGVVIWHSSQRATPAAFFLLSAGVLLAECLSTTFNINSERLFYLLLAWLAPLVVQFHLTLIQRPEGWERMALKGFYGLSVAWSLLIPVWIIAPSLRIWEMAWHTSIRINLVAALMLAMGVIVREYQRHPALSTRRQIRLIACGTLLAFTPLILRYLLPVTMGTLGSMLYALTLPWLVLGPLVYAFALFRHRMVWAERALSQATIYYGLLTLFLSIFLIIASRYPLVTHTSNDWLLLMMLWTGVVVLCFAPLYHGLQRLINWVLYGNEITYANTVGHFTTALSATLDRASLRRLLVRDFAAHMQLSGVALFLKDPANTLTLLGSSGLTLPLNVAGNLAGNGALAACLEALARPVSSAQLRKALRSTALSAEEQALLGINTIARWLPLISGGTLQGLLLIAARQQGDFFTAEDERIMVTLGHQAGIAAHNVHLVEEVDAVRHELERAHQRALVESERARRRLAHDLHDGVVQQLIGVRYLAEQHQPPTSKPPVVLLETIRHEMLDVVQQLRKLIGELCPAGLEELGLTAALEGYVANLERENSPHMPRIELDLDESGTALPETVAICLFRAAQEAIRNVLNHAQARHMHLCLCLNVETATLFVHDDGCGFRVPTRLSELARADHFGLVGIAERVAWLGGQLTIRSQPGSGTDVFVHVPLNGMEQKNDRAYPCCAR